MLWIPFTKIVAQTSSVLATGSWYKIAITKSGVYRLDNAFLKKAGINPSALSPQTIRIFGNGGGMLPQPNDSGYQNALKEQPLLAQGEGDGKFDPGDAVYFYAEGPHIIRYDSIAGELQHQINTYSDTSYYFLNFGDRDGLRMNTKASIQAPSAQVVTQFDDYWYHETESANLLKSGRQWWGEYLGAGSVNLEVALPGIVPGSDIKMRTSAIGAAQVNTRFIWKLNGTQIGEGTIGTVTTSTYDVKGLRQDKTFNTTAPNDPNGNFNIQVSYDKNGQNAAQAYLNYIALQVKRSLNSYEGQQIFYLLPAAADSVSYRFKNTRSGWYLWDIADANNPLMLAENTPASDFAYQTAGSKKLTRMIGFTLSDALVPNSIVKIKNQNLSEHDTPDLLIVTPAAWQSEASRLADFRKQHDQLETLVVTTDQVYNEFSSGRPDVSAIRDFVRSLHAQSPGKLKYLLLFGDATYDYKNLLQNQSAQQRASWVPVYESIESLNPVYTYSSDDYYGFLDAKEGTWTESAAGDHLLDIGIGRLPVKSVAEARIIVDKLIRYGTLSRSAGIWKNNVQFVADDGDANIHQQHADQLARLIGNNFLSSRFFIDAYPQTTTDQGQKVPAVNQLIRKKIYDGTLILNYTGHGGVSGWAEEQILTLADMQAARGIDNLPLLFTATCDFGRYDDPAVVSGAEIMVLSPKGAAIGAISTTRPVYSSTNFTLSQAFYGTLIAEIPQSRMGDIFKETKNNALAGSLNRNFTLLGDPSMRLARAENGIRWSAAPDTLRALDKVTLNGEIYNVQTKLRDQAFDGTARIVVYDKPISIQTLGNEGNPQEYAEYGSRIFDGNVRVTAGRFSATLVVPKDIDYRVGQGRVNVYALRGDSLADASGQLNVVVGGSAELVPDDTPPTLKAYIDNEDFRDGDRVAPSSELIVRVQDDSGINISSAGVGHDMTLTLNDTLTVLLNDYYTADLDQYQSGTIRFPLENLPPGIYQARVKVWDVYTNFSEIAFGFQVDAAAGISLNTLNIYPNPFDKDLSFELSHNRAGEDVEIIFNILLNNGQSIGVFKRQYYNSEPTIRDTLSMLSGNLPPRNTLLIYRTEIRSMEDNSTDSKSGKLIRSP